MSIATHSPLTAFFRSDTDGIEALSFRRESSKSVGSVTFSKAVRLGTLICGAEILPNGLILLTAFTADWITEFAEAISFWIDERMLLNELVKKFEICQYPFSLLKDHEISKLLTYLLCCAYEQRQGTPNDELQETQ